MKRIIAILFCSIISTYSISQGNVVLQEKDTIAGYFFEPAYIDSYNIEHPLPNEKVKILTYKQVFKTSLILIMDSVHSHFLIPSNPAIRMIVKCNSLVFNGNPKDYFRLYELTVNNKTKDRRCIVATNKSFVNSITNYNDGLRITFNKLSNDVYGLVFEDLKNGNYALLVNKTVYSFEVK